MEITKDMIRDLKCFLGHQFRAKNGWVGLRDRYADTGLTPKYTQIGPRPTPDRTDVEVIARYEQKYCSDHYVIEYVEAQSHKKNIVAPDVIFLKHKNGEDLNL